MNWKNKRLSLLRTLFLILIFNNHNVISQKCVLSVESKYLDTVRNISMVKSDNFDSTKPYQLYMVFDESVLFDYTVSLLKYVNNWKELPQYIVLGVPNKNRWNELQARENETLEENSFYNFISKEVQELPCVKKSTFRILIGHSLSASFVTHLFLNSQKYSGLIAISPALNTELRNKFLNYSSRKVFDKYAYLSSSKDDLGFHKKFFQETMKSFDSLSNYNIMMDYAETGENNSHTFLPIKSLLNGILFILDDYFNLPEKRLKNINADDYRSDSLMESYYNKIYEIYGITPEIRASDIQLFVAFYISNSIFREAHRLCDLNIEIALGKQAYDLVDAYYLKGLVFENENKFDRALEYYEKGFSIIPDDVLNKDDFEEDIIRLKRLNAEKPK